VEYPTPLRCWAASSALHSRAQFVAPVPSTTADKTMFVARSGRTRRSKFGQAYSRPGLTFRGGGPLPHRQVRPAQRSTPRGIPAWAESRSISRQRPRRKAAARPPPSPRTASRRSRYGALPGPVFAMPWSAVENQGIALEVQVGERCGIGVCAGVCVPRQEGARSRKCRVLPCWRWVVGKARKPVWEQSYRGFESLPLRLEKAALVTS
jgi:hypothetical protein